MTAFDDRILPLAYRLLNTYGRLAVFSVTAVSASNYDPNTGLTTIPAATTYSRKICPPYPYEKQFVDGVSIKQADLRTFLAAESLGFTPVVGMKVADMSETFTIIAVNPISSGESIAVYELQLRK